MKILSRIMYGTFGLVLFLSAALFIAPSVPYLGHLEIKIVKSGSMEPSIMTGGIVAVRRAPTYVEGDVITFMSDGSEIPTTHRIVGTEELNGKMEFVTKGDANEERDTETVPESAVLGKVLLSLPYVGFILDFARQPIGFGLLIGVPAFLIVLDEIEKIWRELGRIRRKKMKDLREVIEPLIVAPYVPPDFRVRMMDINQPIMVANGHIESDRAPAAKREVHKPPQAYPHWMMAAGSSLIMVAILAGLSTVGGTISYFSDIERSLANTLGAGTLDFTATVTSPTTAFHFVVTDGILEDFNNTLSIDIALAIGSTPMLYDLAVLVNATGSQPFCDAVLIDSGSPLEYAESITALVGTSVPFNGTWDSTIDLNMGGGYNSGDTCTIELKFSGWNAAYPTALGGYEDVESIFLTFTVTESASLMAPMMLELQGASVNDTEEGETPEEIDNTDNLDSVPPTDEEGLSSEEETEAPLDETILPDIVDEEPVSDEATQEPDLEEEDEIQPDTESESVTAQEDSMA